MLVFLVRADDAEPLQCGGAVGANPLDAAALGLAPPAPLSGPGRRRAGRSL